MSSRTLSCACHTLSCNRVVEFIQCRKGTILEVRRGGTLLGSVILTKEDQKRLGLFLLEGL